MDGLAGSGGGGGIMQSEVTPEDEEAISRLMALGFPRGAAIQALLVTMQCIIGTTRSACTEPCVAIQAFSRVRDCMTPCITHCRPSWRATRTRTSRPTSSSTKGTTSSKACAPAAPAGGVGGWGWEDGGGGVGGRQAVGVGGGGLAARCRMTRLAPLQHCASTYESACRSRESECAAHTCVPRDVRARWGFGDTDSVSVCLFLSDKIR